MSNTFVSLPVPVGNGIGASVDVSTFGALKTIVVTGTAQSTKNIEFNNDAAQGGSWQSIATIQNNNQTTVQVAARWMRVRVTAYNSNVGGTSSVNMGGTDAGCQFAALPVSVGTGVGAAVDVTALLGTFKTVQVGGPFQGTTIIEVSEDGATEWSQPFSFQTPGQQSAVIIAGFMRVRRVGVPVVNPGLPVVNVGFAPQSEGSTSSSVAISAGTQVATTGTVKFANSNGVTFGMSGSSQITASYSQSTAPGGIAAGTQTATSGTVLFSNGNGITFGLNGSVMTGSVQTAGGTATGVGISAGTQVASTGAVVFSNSNGVSFGMSASTVTASYSQSTAPSAIAAGTQTAASGTVVFSNSNNVTFGMSGSTRITASVPAETPFGISAGTQSASTGTMVFANSNGVTFGMSGSNQITASYSQSTAPAAISAGTASVGAGTVVFSNSNGVSFGLNGSTVTASYTQAAQSTGPGAIAAGSQTAASGTVVFANSNGVTFGMSGSTQITASYTQSTGIAGVSAGTNSVSSGVVVFSNSNNVTFGLVGQTVTASTPTVAIVVKEEGSSLGSFTAIDFLGAGVTAADAGGGVASVTVPGSTASPFYFGTGSDGDVTLDGTTTVLGMVPSGNTYVGLRSYQFNNLTINSGVTFRPDGYPYYVAGNLAGSGTISTPGNPGITTAQGAAAWASDRPLPNSAVGGAASGLAIRYAVAGNTTGGAIGANNGSAASAFQGGAGGGGAGGAGTNGGVVTLASFALGDWEAIENAGIGYYSGSAGGAARGAFSIGSGGGGGGSNGANQAGGGSGGGYQVGYVFAFTGTVVISAIGGAGANGFNSGTGFSGGGGGGGAGGIVVLFIGKGATAPTPVVTGGAGGTPSAGTGGAGSGSAGGAGKFIIFQ
jgi:hypothetical protein